MARAVARELRAELFEIDGVSKIDERDLRDPEFTVLVTREKLERYDVTLEEVVALLAATNRNVPAGELGRADGGEYGVKAAGNYLTAGDLEETVIRQDTGIARNVHLFARHQPSNRP